MHARSAVALELGVSAGQYPGGPVDFFTTPKAYRVNFGSVDAPIRFGAALSADWEVFYSIGPYLSFAGRDACRTNGTSRFACRSRPYFNTGFMSDVELQWTHPSGFTLGGQGSGSMGSAEFFGFNLDAAAVVTLGYRFGHVPRVFQEATHRQPESPCRPDCPAES